MNKSQSSESANQRISGWQIADTDGPTNDQPTNLPVYQSTNLPLTTVIIPNWNGAHHLPTCLASLRRQTYPRVEVIVADNGSTDGSLDLLARDYPWVRVLPLGENRGFARACNAGMRAAQGEFVVLLNNDTEADPRWLAEVVAAFQRHPEAGIVASRMLLFDRRDTFHTAGDFYRVDGIPGNRGVWKRDEGQYDREEYVFSACGGSAAYRRAMLEQVGLLDEDFFFSCEDVDLAWRAQLAGWRCVYAPRAVVYHKLSATGGGTTASFYDGRNFIYLLTKDYPGDLWRTHWRAILGAQLRITAEALRAWRGAAARARLRGQLAGLLGLPRMLRKRRAVQRSRTVDRSYLESILTGVDESP
nr:glycosyltransferase family 2 protein [Anaerolineae bacterium]